VPVPRDEIVALMLSTSSLPIELAVVNALVNASQIACTPAALRAKPALSVSERVALDHTLSAAACAKSPAA
jgi:hypothetical protein